MGVQTKGLIHSRFSVEQVETVLEKRLNMKVESITYSCGFFQVVFKHEDTRRQLAFHPNVTDYPLDGHILTLGADMLGQTIMRQIVEVFGGLYTENDCQDNWQLIEGSLGKSNAHFVIDWAVIHGHTDNTFVADAREAFEVFNKKHK